MPHHACARNVLLGLGRMAFHAQPLAVAEVVAATFGHSDDVIGLTIGRNQPTHTTHPLVTRGGLVAQFGLLRSTRVMRDASMIPRLAWLLVR